jgi:DNA repair exonuclease SbcCD ATPase subunit
MGMAEGCDVTETTSTRSAKAKEPMASTNAEVASSLIRLEREFLELQNDVNTIADTQTKRDSARAETDRRLNNRIFAALLVAAPAICTAIATGSVALFTNGQQSDAILSLDQRLDATIEKSIERREEANAREAEIRQNIAIILNTVRSLDANVRRIEDRIEADRRRAQRSINGGP